MYPKGYKRTTKSNIVLVLIGKNNTLFNRVSSCVWFIISDV
jgi:hypothetical protein